jgi:hypothetical protein
MQSCRVTGNSGQTVNDLRLYPGRGGLLQFRWPNRRPRWLFGARDRYNEQHRDHHDESESGSRGFGTNGHTLLRVGGRDRSDEGQYNKIVLLDTKTRDASRNVQGDRCVQLDD